jgi:hypothetical protein
MGVIISALLAFSMVIFPIAMPRAAVPGAQRTIAMSDQGHVHGNSGHAHDEASLTCGQLADHHGCGDHDPGSHDANGIDCCGMGACHAFQISAAPDLQSPLLLATPVGTFGDEQVEGFIPAGLDRPPRTV